MHTGSRRVHPLITPNQSTEINGIIRVVVKISHLLYSVAMRDRVYRGPFGYLPPSFDDFPRAPPRRPELVPAVLQHSGE